MALFIAIVIHNSGEIFFRSFRPYIVKSHIISNSKSTRTKVPLFTFLFLKSLFKLFSNLLRGFRIIGGIICMFRVLDLWLRLFNFRVFYSSGLTLYLGHNDVSRMIVLLSLVIHHPDVKSRLEAYFCFNLNRLLNHFFPSVR